MPRLPSLRNLRLWPGRSPVPIEEYDQDALHVVRVELPGREPDEMDITVADNEVTIMVRPGIHVPRPLSSEFDQGSAHRTIMLPRGSKDDTLTATYDADGILELAVQVSRPVPIGRRVPVRVRR